MKPLSGAHEARERCAAAGRQPIFLHPFSGATKLRSDTPLPGGSPFLGIRCLVQPSRVSDTPFPGWGVSPSADGGNGRAAPALGQKGRDTYGFPPSLNSYLSLSNLANEPYGSTS